MKWDKLSSPQQGENGTCRCVHSPLTPERTLEPEIGEDDSGSNAVHCIWPAVFEKMLFQQLHAHGQKQHELFCGITNVLV